MRIAFVTNFCPHYRVNMFELLSQSSATIDYYFYSAGSEWYWQREHGVQKGNFHFEYLSGIKWGRTRITPSLISKLWSNNYDVYIKCINGRFALPITYLLARLKRKPFVLWTGIWTRINKPLHKLFFLVTRYIYLHSDAIVVYGQHVKDYLISEGVEGKRIFLANHAVDNLLYNRKISDSEKKEIRSTLNIPSRSKVILYLGRLEAIKGLPYLIEAFSRLDNKDAVLVLAGDGSETEQLDKLVGDHGISDRVRFAGYVPVENAIYYYATAWVYVLPSITMPEGKETWGLVINEAMNQGTPIIATDAVGAAAGGLVQDGVNGFVVPERDCQALANAIEKILTDVDLHDRMAQNSIQLISGWNNEWMVQGFKDAIDYVTSSQ